MISRPGVTVLDDLQAGRNGADIVTLFVVFVKKDVVVVLAFERHRGDHLEFSRPGIQAKPDHYPAPQHRYHNRLQHRTSSRLVKSFTFVK
jgi:hypothetical protein